MKLLTEKKKQTKSICRRKIQSTPKTCFQVWNLELLQGNKLMHLSDRKVTAAGEGFGENSVNTRWMEMDKQFKKVSTSTQEAPSGWMFT